MSISWKPWVVATCATVMLAIGAPQASALQRPTPQGASAISSRAASIPAALRRDYYATAVGEPGLGESGGAWHYFRGEKGQGAIYWSAATGAQLVYGPFLDYYARNGEEGYFGYPVGDPVRGPNDRCDGDAYAYQVFQRAVNVGRNGGGQLSASQNVLCQRSEDIRTGVYEGLVFN